MKKNLIKAGWMMGLALLASTAITACGNDDKPEISDAAHVAGTYAGTANVNVMGTDCGDMTFDVVIAEEEDGTATVTLPQCSFTPPIQGATELTITAVPVHGVKVTESGNAYTVSIDAYTETINNVTYTGKIEGKIIGKNADIQYVIRPGRMPMDINFDFKGMRK